jgi:hypothetical protein
VYLRVTQVHLERLERLKSALDVGRINGPYRNGKSKTPIYLYTVARQDQVLSAMKQMWPYLGTTTKNRLRKLLSLQPLTR